MQSQPNPSRKTRGPRTAGERADDAARSTATRFERLPSSHFADDVLKPLAVLLRFYTRPLPSRVSLRDVRRLDQVDREYVDFMSREGKFLDLMPVEEGLAVEGALQSIQRRLREAKAMLAAKLAEEQNNA
jgi:hypothetical protein